MQRPTAHNERPYNYFLEFVNFIHAYVNVCAKWRWKKDVNWHMHRSRDPVQTYLK